MESKKSIEIEVYDLLVARDFNELTDHERSLVLELMSKEEFDFRKQLLEISPTLFTEENEIEPAMLILPTERVPFMKRSIPIYQFIVSIAALILAFFLFVPFWNHPVKPNDNTEYITHVDTVFIETQNVDTIVKVEERPVYIETIKYVTESAGELKEAPRLLEVNSSQSSANLDAISLENRGQNMKADPTSILIREYQLMREN